jgi:exopolysaccharide biosynthesis WecB/TagA/CpsF family protein
LEETAITAIAHTSDGPPGAAPVLPTVEFVGMAFTAIGPQSVLDALRARAPGAPFEYVVTPNVDHVVRLQRSRSDLWPAYRRAWMVLCDSRILGRLARWRGAKLPVLPGSDLTRTILYALVEPGDRVAIVGGEAGQIEQLAARFHLASVSHFHPPMGFVHDPLEMARAVQFIVSSQARYAFLAVGSPQQELLAYRVARAGGACGIGFCIGASLDFLTGSQERAPEVFQRLSLEWLYRLCSDPRRLWRRYLVDGPGIFRIARRWSDARGH